ncbi:MAG: efflux RND transporter periplasmic adaptor subunit [Planctomycetota bacterium]
MFTAPTTEVQPQGEPLAVRVVPVQWVEQIDITRRFLGEVQARQRVDLSFDITGTIERIAFDEGDTATAGDVVAVLDADRHKADLMRLQASAQAVASDLELARVTLERVETTLAANAATDQELDEASSAVRTLESRLAEAQASVARTQVDLDKSVIYAPFDALVARRRADVGSLAGPGTVVVSLLERTEPEVRVGVTPRLVLAKGDAVGVKIRGRTHHADVIGVLPEIDRITRTAEVRLAIDGVLGGEVRDGDPAEIEVVSSVKEQGLWVPFAALTQSVRGLWALYVAAPMGENSWQLERREVEVVRPGDGRAFVRGAVETGELVVIDGKHRIVPGLAVRPIIAEPEG